MASHHHLHVSINIVSVGITTNTSTSRLLISETTKESSPIPTIHIAIANVTTKQIRSPIIIVTVLVAYITCPRAILVVLKKERLPLRVAWGQGTTDLCCQRNIHPDKHVHTHVHMHACTLHTHTSIHASIHAYVHTYIPAQRHTHMHTYLHIK